MGHACIGQGWPITSQNERKTMSIVKNLACLCRQSTNPIGLSPSELRTLLQR